MGEGVWDMWDGRDGALAILSSIICVWVLGAGWSQLLEK